MRLMPHHISKFHSSSKPHDFDDLYFDGVLIGVLSKATENNESLTNFVNVRRET